MDVQRSTALAAPEGLALLKQLYTWCAVFVSMGGFLFGYDTGSIGPVTVMPQFDAHFGHLAPAKHGIVVSSILITAAVFSLVAGPLADRISRTRTIALGAVVSGLGEALCLAAPRSSIGMFIAGRCIAGIGEGLFMSPITTYTCEIAPTAVRGRLTVQVQLFVTLGILCGYFTCYGSVRLEGNAMAWRILYAVQIACSVILAVGAMLLPHSPRWLRHVGRHQDAERALQKLGVSPEELGLDELEPVAPMEKGQEAASKPEHQSLWEMWMSLWRKDVRKRTLLGVYLQFGIMTSGIDGILYYAPIVFAQAGLTSNTASFLASGVVGLVNFVVTIPALVYSDRLGRRPPLIWGGFVFSMALLIIAILHATGASDHRGGQYAVIGLIFVYIVAFALSWAVVVRAYVAEIQPMRTRGPATALGQSVCWITNWIIAFTTPLFFAKTTSGPYFLFGGCSLFTTLICVLYARESLGVSLEDLEKEFDTQWTPPRLSHTVTESGRTSTVQ